MKNPKLSTSSVLTVAMIALSVVMVSGCKIKKKSERDAEDRAQARVEAEKDRAQQSAQQSEATAEERERVRKETARLEEERKEQEVAKIEDAKTNLRQRIAQFNTLAGEYAGSYVGGHDAVTDIHIRIEVNALPEGDIVALETEGEVKQKQDALSVNIRTTEVLQNRPNNIICNADNIKPDFFNGAIKFSCQGSNDAASRRDYKLSFATLDVGVASGISSTLSSVIGELILTGQIVSLEAFRLNIEFNNIQYAPAAGALTKRTER